MVISGTIIEYGIQLTDCTSDYACCSDCNKKQHGLQGSDGFESFNDEVSTSRIFRDRIWLIVLIDTQVKRQNMRKFKPMQSYADEQVWISPEWMSQEVHVARTMG